MGHGQLTSIFLAKHSPYNPTLQLPWLQVPSKLKEVLKGHIEKAEMRLHEQQRRLAQQKRLSRAQDSVMSEDEKKKRKKKLKVGVIGGCG